MVFEVFRKRQKEMLVVLVLVAMFSFIIGDFLYQFARGGGRDPGDPRVGEVWGKPRSRSELERLKHEREAAQGVLSRLVKAAGTSADYAKLARVFGDYPWLMLAQRSDRSEADWRPALLAYLAVEGKAEQMGITVSDEEVTQFIQQITGGALKRDDFKQALAPPRRSGESSRERGEAVTENDLYRIVARELKVRKVLQALTGNPDYSAPLDFWRQRIEDARTTYTVEMVRLPTEKFIDAKAEPTNTELQGVYDRYKGVEPNPEKGVVGFQQPAKAEFEYVTIPVERWLDQVKVTPEEGKKHYDDNQKDFIETFEPPPPDPPGLDKKVPPPPPKKPDSAPKKEDDKAGKKEDKKLELPNPDAKSAPKDKKTGAWPSLNLLRSIATTSAFVQAQDAKKAPDAPPKNEKTAAAPEQKKTEPPKADANPPDAAKKAAPPPPVPPGAGQAKVGENVPPLKIRPFAAVKADIERKLKTQKAKVLVREKVTKTVETDMKPYGVDYIIARRRYADANNGSTEGFKPPTPPKSMEQLKLEMKGGLHTIGPATEDAVRKMPDFGKLFRAVDNIYDEKKLDYNAEVESDFDENNFYVYWRTKLTQPSSLPLETVRDPVIAVWRREQAQKPAKEAADKLAEAVMKSGFPEAVKGTEFKPFTAPAFRRYQALPLGMGNPTRLSSMQRIPTRQVDGVPDAEQEFLDEVVTMEQGDVKVLPGTRRDNFYVVKLVKREPPSFNEFADEYELWARRSPAQQEQMSEQGYAFTALEVLRESGFEEPEPPRSEKGRSGKPTADAPQ